MTSNSAGFAPYHRWDRRFFLLMVGLIWLGILLGFGPEIVAHVTQNKSPFPIIVHIHAVAFIAWLLLLTTQVLLIGSGNVARHQKLGVAGMVLAPIMVVLGFAAAEIVDYLNFGTPQGDPPFLAIQYADLINFGTLAAAAFLLRHQPSAHKRLIILATIFISDAGWARWSAETIAKAVGSGFWQDYLQFYMFDPLLVALFAGYDLITRKRLNPVFVKGALFGIAVQLVAIWLYVSPWWKPIATHLIGR